MTFPKFFFFLRGGLNIQKINISFFPFLLRTICTPLKYSLYCASCKTPHYHTLQRFRRDQRIHTQSTSTDGILICSFELLSLICVTRARVFIFIAFTKAATREHLVRWRTDLHNYQEKNRLLRVVPGVYKKEEEKKRGEEFSNR